MMISAKLLRSAAAAALAILISGEAALARGGAASIMNSPGYQRRLQESRQQLVQPDAKRMSGQRHKRRHPSQTAK
jgi:hypothetical protein